MSEETIIQTVDVPEAEVKPDAPAAPSHDELKQKGWSSKELEAAEKRGMIPKKEEKKPAEPVKAEEKQSEPAEEPKAEEKKPAEKPRSSWPEFELTPEQQKVWDQTFPPGTPPRGLIHRLKNERLQRQAAQARIRELEAQMSAVSAPKPEKKVEIDENGNEIDPEDKPLTMKQLREMQKKEAEEREQQENELRNRARVVKDAQKSQEEYVRSLYPDFDEVVKAATVVLPKLDELVDDPKIQKRAARLFHEMEVAGANADRLGPDDYTAADIAYELGVLLKPYGTNHGQSAEPHNDGKPERPEPKANGGLTPEQKMKRIEDNTQRRASSASIPGGGGRRSVTPEEVSLADLNRMNFQERQRFKDKHPDQYAKLLRG